MIPMQCDKYTTHREFRGPLRHVYRTPSNIEFSNISYSHINHTSSLTFRSIRRKRTGATLALTPRRADNETVREIKRKVPGG